MRALWLSTLLCYHVVSPEDWTAALDLGEKNGLSPTLRTLAEDKMVVVDLHDNQMNEEDKQKKKKIVVAQGMLISLLRSVNVEEADEEGKLQQTIKDASLVLEDEQIDRAIAYNAELFSSVHKADGHFRLDLGPSMLCLADPSNADDKVVGWTLDGKEIKVRMVKRGDRIWLRVNLGFAGLGEVCFITLVIAALFGIAHLNPMAEGGVVQYSKAGFVKRWVELPGGQKEARWYVCGLTLPSEWRDGRVELHTTGQWTYIVTSRM